MVTDSLGQPIHEGDTVAMVKDKRIKLYLVEVINDRTLRLSTIEDIGMSSTKYTDSLCVAVVTQQFETLD